MADDQDLKFLLKAAVLKACSRQRIEQTQELTRSTTALEREHEQARRLLENSRTLMQRVRLLCPEKDEDRPLP